MGNRRDQPIGSRYPARQLGGRFRAGNGYKRSARNRDKVTRPQNQAKRGSCLTFFVSSRPLLFYGVHKWSELPQNRGFFHSFRKRVNPMANVNDYVRISYITELRGKQMRNQQYYQIAAINGAAVVPDVLDAVGTAWFLALQPIITNQMSLACLIWENLTTIGEKSIVFPALVGGSAGGDHPQFSVINFETIGQDGVGTARHHNRHRISGITEPRSIRGRIENRAILQNFVNHLSNFIDTGNPGMNLAPQTRWLFDPTPPATYSFSPVVKCNPGSIFRTLQSRKTTLCS